MKFIRWLIILPCFLAHAGAASDTTGLFLFRRAVYLEDASVPGAWMANPASALSSGRTTVLTSNVLPLGDCFVLASARCLFPIVKNITLGAGVLGTGVYQSGSSFAGGGDTGFGAQADFHLSGPLLQIVLASPVPLAGSLGGDVSLGWETVHAGGSDQTTYYDIGFGLGWQSPLFVRRLGCGLSAMTIGKVGPSVTVWDNSMRAGIFACLPDSQFRLTADYAFPLDAGSAFFSDRDDAPYQVVKAIALARLFGPLNAAAGFSSDFPGRWTTHGIRDGDNGNCLHLEVALDRSAEYAFFGGYDIGISTTYRLSMLHRFWFGYVF